MVADVGHAFMRVEAENSPLGGDRAAGRIVRPRRRSYGARGLERWPGPWWTLASLEPAR